VIRLSGAEKAENVAIPLVIPEIGNHKNPGDNEENGNLLLKRKALTIIQLSKEN